MEGGVNIFIGAENVVSGIGLTAEANFENCLSGKTAIKSNRGRSVASVNLSDLPFANNQDYSKIELLCQATIHNSLKKFSWSENDKWLVVLSTTKGDIDQLKKGNIKKTTPLYLGERIKNFLPFKTELEIISLACISGVAAVIYAADILQTTDFDHVLVLGADILSDFTSKGFESFFALDPEPCKPFDKDRKGLNLGEGAASVVLSKSRLNFENTPFIYFGGSTSNDANHISGPSRTGEGLFQAIKKAKAEHSVSSNQIDFISAHGTGTKYNDDMESLAFNRHQLEEVPTNSLKGYYGHTLGASGLVEISISLQMMRNNTLIPSYGCKVPGTAKAQNIILEPRKKALNTILKTASGFGGVNAAILIKKSTNGD